MGSPRFRRLEYDLYEALMRAKLPGSTYQVVLVVIDHTIGYRRETAHISLSRFQDKTNLSRRGVTKAIKDAERRGILAVSRLGVNAKTPASYTLSTEYAEWLTGKQPLTGRLVNSGSPDQGTAVHQTSKHLMPATPPERNLNKTLKKRGTIKKEDTEIRDATASLEDASASLNSNSVTSPDSDKRTAFNDKKGSRKRGRKSTPTSDKIEAHLLTHGTSPIKAISEDTGINRYVVAGTLQQAKGKRFIHYPELRAWGVPSDLKRSHTMTMPETSPKTERLI